VRTSEGERNHETITFDGRVELKGDQKSINREETTALEGTGYLEYITDLRDPMLKRGRCGDLVTSRRGGEQSERKKKRKNGGES